MKTAQLVFIHNTITGTSPTIFTLSSSEGNLSTDVPFMWNYNFIGSCRNGLFSIKTWVDPLLLLHWWSESLVSVGFGIWWYLGFSLFPVVGWMCPELIVSTSSATLAGVSGWFDASLILSSCGNPLRNCFITILLRTLSTPSSDGSHLFSNFILLAIHSTGSWSFIQASAWNCC